LARVVTAQRRGEPAFASAAGGAEHHDAFSGHNWSFNFDFCHIFDYVGCNSTDLPFGCT
jgi:hypothetical protein